MEAVKVKFGSGQPCCLTQLIFGGIISENLTFPKRGEKMADVIEIKEIKKKKTDSEKIKKIISVRKILQCTMCTLKCAKCGMQVDMSDTHLRKLPFRLCEDCQEEYKEYQARLDGGKVGPFYWRNKEWMAIWKAWIDYQESLRQYRESKEFIILLNELEKLKI